LSVDPSDRLDIKTRKQILIEKSRLSRFLTSMGTGLFANVLKITTIVAILRTIGVPVDQTAYRFHIQSLLTPGIGAVITANEMTKPNIFK
jgi:hypothetical protein